MDYYSTKRLCNATSRFRRSLSCVCCSTELTLTLFRGLRESFLLLKDVASSKVEDSSSFVATVLFLRLICPCLVVPERDESLDGLGLTLTEHGKRGLVIASKILQSAANNFPWENRAGSALVNEFIAQANPLIVNFASKLIV